MNLLQINFMTALHSHHINDTQKSYEGDSTVKLYLI